MRKYNLALTAGEWQLIGHVLREWGPRRGRPLQLEPTRDELAQLEQKISRIFFKKVWTDDPIGDYLRGEERYG